MGRLTLTALLVLMIAATAVADLGFMHASNPAWPPHARLHAIWNVVHVAGTHLLALGLLWVGPNAGSVVRVRIAVGVLLAFVLSFFVAATLAPGFDGSVHPDLPAADRPPTLFGLDGNSLGFLLVLPIVLLAWLACEKRARSGE
jgi:hypothetical protein